MTKLTEEELAQVAAQIGELMPKAMRPVDLVSLILTILHAYFEVDDVPNVLRQMADATEADADGIKKLLADVAE